MTTTATRVILGSALGYRGKSMYVRGLIIPWSQVRVLLGPPIKASSVLLCHTSVTQGTQQWQLAANVITVSKFKCRSANHIANPPYRYILVRCRHLDVSNTSFYYSFLLDTSCSRLCSSLFISFAKSHIPDRLDSYRATCLLSFCSSGVTSPPVKPRSLMR